MIILPKNRTIQMTSPVFSIWFYWTCPECGSRNKAEFKEDLMEFFVCGQCDSTNSMLVRIKPSYVVDVVRPDRHQKSIVIQKGGRKVRDGE